MADSRFHDRKGPFSLGELAERTGAELAESADPARRLADVAPLESAGADDLSFLDNRRYVEAFAASKAGGCVVHPDFVARAPKGMALLVTEKPYRSLCAGGTGVLSADETPVRSFARRLGR